VLPPAKQEAPVSQHTSVQPVLIERPPCPQCGAQMMVARIRPHTLGTDERTYECAKCRFVETLLTQRRA
jgi:predicted RNA-binding Zn-ribbon protein involved in translation (DUF1610 family)